VSCQYNTLSTDDLTSGTTHDNVVQQVLDALVKAANLYKQENEKALSKGEYYNDFVKVELPGGHWLPIDQL